jgi:manganese/zinc/iron transport system permease protein
MNDWPDADQILRVFTLRDYNTRVVLFGTLLLGIAGGLVGVFLLLRRRSLAADVVSHATFPGIAIAFLVMEAFFPQSGKSTPALLTGAFLSGILGLVCTTLIQRYTRIKEDAALAIVLSVFFGLGVALFTVIQSIPSGNVAGLGHFIYGKAASMVAADVHLIAWASLGVTVIFMLLFKELTLVSFDEQFAASQGWPILMLDLLLLGMVTSVTVIGLQSVGMLLVVALMVIPPTAARCWTHDLHRMTIISALVGAFSAIFGVLTSALFPRLAAGAVIVLAGTGMFILSMLFGTRSGVVTRAVNRFLRNRTIGMDHLLRALFEAIEPKCIGGRDLPDQLPLHSITIDELRTLRTWSVPRLRKLIRQAQSLGYVVDYGQSGVKLTERGAMAACRVVRNHRLWELYLIEYADRPPNRVDRDADSIEHFLGPEVIARLERLVVEKFPGPSIPPSPHVITPPQTTGAGV